VDPTSMVNILVGECGGTAPTVWDGEEPVLHAKGYGKLASAYDNACLYADATPGATSSSKLGRKSCENAPKFKWTLTMDDELKSDFDSEADRCVETAGALSGDWSDLWSPGEPSITLTLNDDGTVDSNRCDKNGWLSGKWHDKFNGNMYTICMTGNQVRTSGGASGTYNFGTLHMFGISAKHEGVELKWTNNNVWTRKENYSPPASFDGNTLTYDFTKTGVLAGTLTATLVGDQLQWSNKNLWNRSPALKMAACTGASNQKWTLDSSGNLKSKLDEKTCLNWADAATPYGVSAGGCMDSTQGKWEFKDTPSWVTEG